ncbi:alpha/beta hydrolase-fold protein [Gordonia sp. VNQ95]|uniref:alpha/beta hydrolase n=1 Tax=Gordonia sp. VNQ95 TaxID=3156619 RepID=UPI0032B5D0B0
MKISRTTAAGIAASVAVSLALTVGAGTAAAVNPTVERTSAGCTFANAADKANNIQTCRVWSESMQTYVTVRVRPSSQQTGQQEQAIYTLGGINDPSGSGGSLYSDQYNLVMISGSTSMWSSNWEEVPVDANGKPLTATTPQWETFIGEELPAYLNENFDIDESGNAIAGLSISGGQAINLALKYPEVFSVALSTSGYYQTNNLLGYLLIPYILSSRQGISNGFDGLWGNPFSAGNVWADNDVSGRIYAAKSNGQTIIVSTGNGLVSSEAEWQEFLTITGGDPVRAVGEAFVGGGLEFVSFLSALILNAQASLFGLPVEFIYTTGAHTWQRWSRTDEEEAHDVQDALKKYETATTTQAAAPASGSVSALRAAVTSSETPESESSDVESDSTTTSATTTSVETSTTSQSSSSATATTTTGASEPSSAAPSTTDDGADDDDTAPITTAETTRTTAPAQ